MPAPDFKPLAPPPEALEKGGKEILRAVIVDRGLSVSLERAFDKPEVWGILLADIARHAARIFAAEEGMPEAEALEKICDLFDREMMKPTDLGTTQKLRKN